jgi:hypothetical protein
MSTLAAVAALCLAAGTAQAAGSSRPKITALTLSPSSLGHSGGTTHLHATVKHTTSCRVSVSPHLAGLPKTRSCSSGHLALSFHVGTNPTAAPRKFTVTLKALKASHHVTKTVHLKQAGTLPSVASFSASPVSLPASGGFTTVTAAVAHGSTCQLSVSPAVAGLPASVACTGASYSHQATLPANTSTTAASYAFTLKVTGPDGSVTVSTHPVVAVAGAAQPGGGGGTPPSPPAVQPITSISSAAAPLPAGAETGASDDTVLNSVSCPAAGDCVAVGTYDSGGDPYNGLIETYNGTGWTAAQAPQPANAYTITPGMHLNSVSCSSATSCVAVGQFVAESGGIELGFEPYIAVLSGSTWTAATVSTPGGSMYPGGDLNQVSCAPDGACVAVGFDNPGPSQKQALIEQSASGGSWISTSPVPAGADPTPTNNYLNSVSCTGSNACTAVGGYVSGGTEYGLGEVLSANVWSPSQLPPTGDIGEDTAVSCAGSSCAATGEYNTNVSEVQSEVGGSWSYETTPLPIQNDGGPELYALDCSSSNSCIGVGTYYSTGSDVEGLIDYGSGTSYTAQTAPLPSSHAANPHGDLQGISCGTTGACVAAGSYQDTSSNGQALIETESDTGGTPSWTAASPAAPGGGSFLNLYAISCFGTYGCVAVGDYLNVPGGVSGEIVVTPS